MFHICLSRRNFMSQSYLKNIFKKAMVILEIMFFRLQRAAFRNVLYFRQFFTTNFRFDTWLYSKLLSSYIIKLFFLFNNHILDYFFHWWLVYKQLALGWKNFKQLSGFNPLSLSNNINYWLKKSEVFSFVINVK